MALKISSIVNLMFPCPLSFVEWEYIPRFEPLLSLLVLVVSDGTKKLDNPSLIDCFFYYILGNFINNAGFVGGFVMNYMIRLFD